MINFLLSILFFSLSMFGNVYANTVIPSTNISVNTSSFTNCLNSSNTNVQTALNSIDTCLGSIGGGGEYAISFSTSQDLHTNKILGVTQVFSNTNIDNATLFVSTTSPNCSSGPAPTFMLNCHSDPSCQTSPSTIANSTGFVGPSAVQMNILSGTISAGEYIGWKANDFHCASDQTFYFSAQAHST